MHCEASVATRINCNILYFKGMRGCIKSLMASKSHNYEFFSILLGGHRVITDRKHMKYRSAPRVHYGSEHENVNLYRTALDSIIPVNKSVATMLVGCKSFRSMEEHALSTVGTNIESWLSKFLQRIRMSRGNALRLSKRYVEQYRANLEGSAHFGNTVKQLEILRNCGLLIDESIFNIDEKIEAINCVRSISKVVIPTNGRPLLLNRCLRSIADNIRQNGRHCTIVIAEDDVHNEKDSREILGRVADEYNMEAEYIGLAEKQHFCAELTREGIPNYISRFAILGFEHSYPRMGANRNALLLNSVGEMIFSCDDDTVAKEFRQAPMSEKRFFGKNNPVETWHFGSSNELLDSLHYSEIDIIAEHEKHLGQSLSAFVRENKPLVDDICDHAIENLLIRTGKIVLTINGLAGDSGMFNSTFTILETNPETRIRLTRNQDQYKAAINSRQLIRCVSGVSVGHCSFMSTMFGIDNRDLLPPFVPVFRGEDDVMGFMLASGGTGLYLAYLPFGLLHWPADNRRYPNHIQSASYIRVCQIFKSIIFASGGDKLGLDLGTQMRLVGSVCIGLGRLPLPEFIIRIRALMLESQNRFMEILARQLDEDLPPYWHADIREIIRECQNNNLSDVHHFPVDLPLLIRRTESMELLQQIIRFYGELITWWPDISEAAKRLSVAGIKLGAPIKRAHSRTC